MLLELKVLFFFDIEIESKNYSAAVRLASGASHMGAKTLTEGFSLRSRPPLASLSAHAFCDLGIADIEKLEKSKDNALISSSSGAKAGHSISIMPSASAWRGETELMLPLTPNRVDLPSSK